MPPALDGARMKIDRARKQIRFLESEFQRFYDAQTYVVTQEPDFETGRKRAQFRITSEFPEDWSIIIGEIVHDLRSALDHAVYELTVRECGRPLVRTEFPVFDDEAKYLATKKNGDPIPASGLYKIRGINAEAQAVVKTLQPFEFRKNNAADQEPLIGLLHELSIVDKHRTIHISRRVGNRFRFEFVREVENGWEIGFVEDTTLEDGTSLGWWTPVGPLDDKVDVEFTIEFAVTFADTVSVVRNQPVIKLLDALHAATEEALVFLYLTLHLE